VAAAAANVAVQFLAGETPEAETTLYDTPSKLFVPAVITAENLKAEIIDKGINTADQLCVDRYAEGCRKLGIIE
jgi:D-xylose transport system substrate-binding protein